VRFTAKFADRAVVVPFDVKKEFGEARPPVEGTVNGTPFRGRLMVYGGVTYLGLRKEIRAAAGIEDGDTVEVEFERDDAPREVEVPAPLAAALAADDEARAAFEALSYSHRKEYADWIADAKRGETKARRAERAVSILREGVERP
jgi:bifunctional DNA-binding transcriptional regulator/antitoxin component of YhaV-PrlF toxin-antitoxin module